MTFDEFCSRLNGVKGTGSKRTAKCPAHEDHTPSLSVSIGDNQNIVVYCHKGCTATEIVDSMGLSMKDLLMDQSMNKPITKTETACYKYTDIHGNLLGEKVRYSDKSFTWRYLDPTKKNYTYQKPKGITLYNAPATLHNPVYIAEGEKDVNTLTRLGKAAVCAPNGAGKSNKWPSSTNCLFKDKDVIVLQDNDDVGKAFALETVNSLFEQANSVKLIDLTTVWTDLPEKGDISDAVNMEISLNDARTKLDRLVSETPEWQESSDPFLSCFKPLDSFNEEEATWLVPGWIPEGQITLMAADGGIGKTTMWCNLVAAVSSGSSCILDPPGHNRQPARVAFLTTEDSVRKKLKRKLRLAGANEHNILTPDFLSDAEGVLRGLKFGSDEMQRFIRYFKPALCVFDPVQGFVPPDINMGSRNAMRDCMAPLISLGEECGTTFLVVCHTNKRKGAHGRDRVADSADLWDVCRSVIMAGYTEDQGIRYLSNEKNNYTQLQKTLLFTIDENGQVLTEGTTWKRDREYMQEFAVAQSAPKREDCKEIILATLAENNGSMPTKELENTVKELGYSAITLRRAKEELKTDRKIKYSQIGVGTEKVWYTESNNYSEVLIGFDGSIA